MIPPGFLQELLERVDIVDVVGQHVELKRGGTSWMGLCPFHAEKSPSFSVVPAKQFYYCFGCGAGGDAIRFLTEHLGLSFVEAVRDLAGRAGMSVPEEQVSPEERERRDTLRQRRLSLHEVLDRAAAFYRQQLKASPMAIAYLKQRGLSGAIAARFGLGYAPPGWKTLAGVFPQYDDPLLEEAGLVRRRDADGEGHPGGDDAQGRDPAAASDRGRYDWFRHRVMFPIRAADGQVMGFGGRVLDDSKPKYMNSPETPVFSKGRELYGLFEARQALREKGFVLVVEGYMDVVALAQSGFGNAVATLGTACTADHVSKLFRQTDRVVFAFDGDAAGRRAAARALEAALPHATDLRSVSFLFLPPEHDPDSYVRTLGADAFERAITEAVPLSRQLQALAAEDCELATAEGRSRMLAQARPLWQALPDGALKRQLLPELAQKAHLEAADLLALWGSDAPAPNRGAAQPAAASTNRKPRLRAAGRAAPPGRADQALRLLLLHSHWWTELGPADQDLLHALPGAHGEAVAWLERQITEHGALTWAALAPLIDPPTGGEAWAPLVRGWMGAPMAEEAGRIEELRLVLDQIRIAHLEQEARERAQAPPTPESLAELRALRQTLAELKERARAEALALGAARNAVGGV